MIKKQKKQEEIPEEIEELFDEYLLEESEEDQVCAAS